MDPSSRPRLAIVTHAFPTPSETFVARRFQRLFARGWDAHVICNESSRSSRTFFDGLPVAGRVHIRPRSTLLAPLIVLRALVAAPKTALRYVLRGGRKGLARLVRDYPLVRLQPDIVHFAFGVDGRGNEGLGTLLDCAVVVSFQGADLNYAGLDEDPAFYRGVFATADAIHFLGEDLARRAQTRGYSLDERARVIKPGVDVAAFEPPEREADPARPLRVLSIGRLHWKKGYEYALHAVRTLVDRGIDVRYRIVGDGPHREAVLYERSDLGLDGTVELLGVLNEAAVRDQLHWADVVLHASTSEGFGYAVVEAQAMEVPVVASDADGLPENVEDGVTGFVVARRDPAALADKLESLASDAALRDRMGRAGRERVLKHFDIEREVDELEDLYVQAIARHGR